MFLSQELEEEKQQQDQQDQIVNPKKSKNIGKIVKDGISSIFLPKSPKQQLSKEKKIPIIQQTNSQDKEKFKGKILTPEDFNLSGDDSELAADLLKFEYLFTSMRSLSDENIRKISSCLKIMSHEPIERKQLSQAIYQGIDDQMKSIRAIIWRILIGYLPPSRKAWISMLEKNMDTYKKLIDENILIKLKKNQQQNNNSQSSGNIQKANDHPLNRSKDSSWNNYFEDQKLWAKIEKDTKRTRQKEGFFQQENTQKFYLDGESTMIAVLSKNRTNMEQEFNYDVLTRILFIFAKLNNGLYVQGMNEIAALIFYCFATDSSIYLLRQAEVDSFYCFSILMSEMKENYQTTQLTSIENNEFLKDRIRQFSDLLKKVDAKLFEHFQKMNIDLKFFCVKWFIAQLTQEFQINQTLKIWDSLICHHQNKNEFIHFISLSILMCMREDLIKGEFGEIITRLQNLDQQNLDIAKIINNASLLWKEFKK